MKVDFVMNNGSIITGDITVHLYMGQKVELGDYLKETGEYIEMKDCSIVFVNNKIDSFVNKIIVSKKDISFSYEVL